MDAAPAKKLLYYSLSLPVTTAVVGMPRFEQIDENIELARQFKPLPKAEMRTLGKSLSEKYKLALDHQLHHHHDHDWA